MTFRIPRAIFLAISLFALLHGQMAAQPTLREKIGQMVMVTVTGDSVEERNPSMDTLKQDLARGLVGGLVMYTWSNNLMNAGQIAHLTAELQLRSGVPLLIAIDQEGGNVARLGPSNGFNATPTAYQLGTVINQESFTRGIAGTMASWFVSTGLNINLAPVVDVDVNPTSPAIGALDRSFSADAEVVALHAGWFMDEFHKKNILTTLKHFPGHGSATTDSHTGFTDVTHTWSAGELVPYTRLINQHMIDAVMTAHVFNSTIDSVYPATLSPPTINGLLRSQLGYTGVVISDAMGMKAISTMYGADQAIELAVRAGVDMLLYTTNLDSAGKSLPSHIVDVIERSVLDGRLSRERIDSSYTRIRSLKNRITTGVASRGTEGLPHTLALANYPNPFNPTTTIRFTLPRGANVRMEVFSLLGSAVATPVNEYLPAGSHQYAFDGSHLASGVYFCRLQADGLVQTIRMMVLK